MITVRFTANLLKHIDVGELLVDADTLQQAVQQLVASRPQLRSYLLDDQVSIYTDFIRLSAVINAKKCQAKVVDWCRTVSVY